jgi:hypothetical protein
VAPQPVSTADPECIAHDRALYQSAFSALDSKHRTRTSTISQLLTPDRLCSTEIPIKI